jgi:hypothetical protein
MGMHICGGGGKPGKSGIKILDICGGCGKPGNSGIKILVFPFIFDVFLLFVYSQVRGSWY